MRIALALLAALVLAGIASASSSTTPIPPGACHLHGQLPDHHCTPGARNRHVKPTNTDRTICVRGYSGRIRPPKAYTDSLKRKQIRQYGYADTRLSSYQEDHLIPLSSGGDPTSPHNLWPQPIADAHVKDRLEAAAHRLICKELAGLRPVQRYFAADWPHAP